MAEGSINKLNDPSVNQINQGVLRCSQYYAWLLRHASNIVVKSALLFPEIAMVLSHKIIIWKTAICVRISKISSVGPKCFLVLLPDVFSYPVSKASLLSSRFNLISTKIAIMIIVITIIETSLLGHLKRPSNKTYFRKDKSSSCNYAIKAVFEHYSFVLKDMFILEHIIWPHIYQGQVCPSFLYSSLIYDNSAKIKNQLSCKGGEFC